MKKNIAFMLLICSSLSAFAQNLSLLEKEEHLLNGTSFIWQYQNAGAVEAKFENDKITYKWLNGRNADQPAMSYDYKSKKVDTDIYLVNWHEVEKDNFVTMVYNFRSNSCSVSVISKYGSEKPFLGFQSGVIEKVQKE